MDDCGGVSFWKVASYVEFDNRTTLINSFLDLFDVWDAFEIWVAKKFQAQSTSKTFQSRNPTQSEFVQTKSGKLLKLILLSKHKLELWEKKWFKMNNFFSILKYNSMFDQRNLKAQSYVCWRINNQFNYKSRRLNCSKTVYLIDQQNVFQQLSQLIISRTSCVITKIISIKASEWYLIINYSRLNCFN